MLKTGTADSRKEWFAVGKYKKFANEVGGEMTAAPDEVPARMKKLVSRYNDLKGIIWGQKEQYYNGTHFQIQEFCVKTSEQNKGYGNTLLKALEKTLSEIGVKNIYLITSKGEKTEGYYAKRGFSTSGNMILMTNHSFMSSFE